MENSTALMKATPREIAEMYEELDPPEVMAIENRIQAHACAQEHARARDERRRLDRAEGLTTEGVEVVASITAGAVSTYKSASNFPTGAAINGVVGTLAKIGSAAFAYRLPEELSPAGRVVRVVCRAGKTLLHTQMGITTRNVILENP